MYTVLCTRYTGPVHCTVYTDQCRLYAAQYTMNAVHWSVSSVQYCDSIHSDG